MSSPDIAITAPRLGMAKKRAVSEDRPPRPCKLHTASKYSDNPQGRVMASLRTVKLHNELHLKYQR